MTSKLTLSLIALSLIIVGIPSTYAADDQAFIQQAGAANNAVVKQIGGTADYADTNQISTGNNNLFVDQDQGTTFDLGSVSVNDNANWAYVLQDISSSQASTNSKLYLKQNGKNALIGAKNDGTLINAPATQLSVNGGNLMVVNQNGDKNKAGVYQKAVGTNDAFITQVGDSNSMAVYQTGNSNKLNAGKNQSGADQSVSISKILFNGVLLGDAVSGTAGQYGNSNSVQLVQTSGAGNNTANISQSNGNNKLAGVTVSNGAHFNGSVAAKQTSVSGNNDLNLIQSGGLNQAGLYQDASTFNKTDIYQSQSDTAAIYQDSANASNTLYIYQSVSDIAEVYQNGSGANTAIVIQ